MFPYKFVNYKDEFAFLCLGISAKVKARRAEEVKATIVKIKARQVVLYRCVLSRLLSLDLTHSLTSSLVFSLSLSGSSSCTGVCMFYLVWRLGYRVCRVQMGKCELGCGSGGGG